MMMGINEKAWAGINIVIYGKTPLLPMKMEQAIAMASPANEVRIDSFEDYDQAYDFCKSQKSVGLILILENSGEGLAADTFKQLGIHYESKGWPCFGTLFHENGKSMLGHLSLQKNKNLLNYYSVEDILDPRRTFSTITEIWNSFVAAFENSIVPTKLQETLISLTEPVLAGESLHFQNRTSVLLSHDLNISWMESIALKWHPVISALKKTNDKALVPNGVLVQIADLAKTEGNASDIVSVTNSKESLCSRISTVVQLLDQARMQNNLRETLEAITPAARPGSPALLRRIAYSKERILAISEDHQLMGVRA